MSNLTPSNRFIFRKIYSRRLCTQNKYKFFGIPVKEKCVDDGFDIPDEPIYDKSDCDNVIRIIVEEAGKEYFHPVSPYEITEKLEEIPVEFLKGLKAIRLCSITRKKKIFYRFGMYLSENIYLYPFSNDLKLAISDSKPKPSMTIEFEKFCGKWVFENGFWYLEFDKDSLKNFYLNNVLIHEIAHHYDRASKEKDRESFADNFVIQFNKGEFSNKFEKSQIKTKIIFVNNNKIVSHR